MKTSNALFACKSACIFLSIFALVGLATPTSYAAHTRTMRKTSATDVIQLSDELELEQQVQRSGLVVVLVYIPTCGACQEVIPQYDNLANTGTPVTYLQVNFNAIPDVTAQLRITAVPTFILYKNGVVIQTITSTDITQLQNAIQQNW